MAHLMHKFDVLEVYRITLLSNQHNVLARSASVLEVYRITLLSNMEGDSATGPAVLEVYRITLLSNPKLNLRLKSNSGYHQV